MTLTVNKQEKSSKVPIDIKSKWERFNQIFLEVEVLYKLKRMCQSDFN